MRLVSIIVPVYNRCDVIKRCYLSLTNQTYKNIEIIFVDDGSTDTSLEIMNNFTDDRVIVVSKKNDGPSEARRYGFKKSKGEYIIFVDSDDKLDKNYIYKLVRSMENNNSNIAMGRLSVHYYYPLIKYIPLMIKRKPKMIDLDIKKEYYPVLTPGIVGKLFKRELLDLKKLDFKANEDIAIMYPMYVKNRYISVVNNTRYHYYLAKNSQFKEYLLGYSLDNLLNTFEPLRYIYDELEKMDKLEDYFYEVEMLFIKNISERIWNIMQCVDDKIYRYKFISVILDYLECFFPDWDKNPYYVRGFKLGEVSDVFHVRVAYEEIRKIKRNKLDLSLEEVYNRYKEVENMYNRCK